MVLAIPFNLIITFLPVRKLQKDHMLLRPLADPEDLLPYLDCFRLEDLKC